MEPGRNHRLLIGGYSIDERGCVPEATVWSLGPDDEIWRAGPALAPLERGGPDE